MEKNRAIAIIPARGGSKGIPGKNIVPLFGKPLIAWMIKAARGASLIDEVYVSTDDDKIADISNQYGAKVIRRPARLADDEASSESALLHALAEIPPSDIVVFLQCTSPLTLAEDINRVVQKMEDEGTDSCFSASAFHHFLWKVDEARGAEGINHDKTFRPRRQDREPQFIETGAVYAMRTEGFMKVKHRFFGKTSVAVIPAERCFEIDEPQDLDVAEALMRVQLGNAGRSEIGFTPEAVIFDFDGVFTDNKVYVDERGVESVRCDRSDGWGLARLKKSGVRLVVMSTEVNGVVQARCRKLGIECHQGLGENKFERYESWCAEAGIDPERTIFVGNDSNDVECLRASGCAIVPSDAYDDALGVADIILEEAGGCGAVRRVCEIVFNRIEKENECS